MMTTTKRDKNKRKWMYYYKLLVLVIIAMTLSQVHPAFAGVTKIYPVGSYDRDMFHPVTGLPCTQDVLNIQSAVLENPGGKIVLKAENAETGATEFIFDVFPFDPYPSFGGGTIYIPHSVVIKGEGSGETMTKIVNGFFPLRIDAGDGDITIKDIHFYNSTGAAIWVLASNDITIVKNKITVDTMKDKTWHNSSLGADVGWGIFLSRDVIGRVKIKNNYIDLEEDGGYVPPSNHTGDPDEPAYRANLSNGEYYVTYGISIHDAIGEVIVKNNVVRNFTRFGVSIVDPAETANVSIKANLIESEIYGSYLFSSIESAIAISAFSGAYREGKGGIVKINNNIINCDKINFGGIRIGSSGDINKLGECSVKNNYIFLNDGLACINVFEDDNNIVKNNELQGTVNLGLWVSALSMDSSGANYNLLKGNEMEGLWIKEPNSYIVPTTHVLLDINTEYNVVKIDEDETVLDYGINNQILYDD